jgi:hypothetical protein
VRARVFCALYRRPVPALPPLSVVFRSIVPQRRDTAVVQGVNHAWSNKSDTPCMIIGVEVHANP